MMMFERRIGYSEIALITLCILLLFIIATLRIHVRLPTVIHHHQQAQQHTNNEAINAFHLKQVLNTYNSVQYDKYTIPKLSKVIVLAMLDSNFYSSIHSMNCLLKSDPTRSVIIVDLHLEDNVHRKIAQSIAGTLYIKFPAELYWEDYGESFLESEKWIIENEALWQPLVTYLVKQHAETIENENNYLTEHLAEMYSMMDQNFLICQEDDPNHSFKLKKMALIVPISYNEMYHAIDTVTKWVRKTTPCTSKSYQSQTDLIFLFYTRQNEFFEKSMMKVVSDVSHCFDAIKFEYADLQHIELREPQCHNHLLYRILFSSDMFLQYTHFFYMDLYTIPVIDNWLAEFRYRVVDSPHKDPYNFWMKGCIPTSFNTRQQGEVESVSQSLSMDISAIYSLSTDFRLIANIVAHSESGDLFPNSVIELIMNNPNLRKSYWHMLQYDDFLSAVPFTSFKQAHKDELDENRPYTIFVKLRKTEHNNYD
jgi:hypothetical protein